jgi:phage shock protein PspC (stress-responsive transcriptional regulator)
MRSRNDRLIAGVCGGLGERYNFDPVLARLGLIIGLIFLTLPVMLLYIAAIFLIAPGPIDITQSAATQEANSRRRRYQVFGFSALALSVFTAFSAFSLWFAMTFGFNLDLLGFGVEGFAFDNRHWFGNATGIMALLIFTGIVISFFVVIAVICFRFASRPYAVENLSSSTEKADEPSHTQTQ